MNQQNIISMLQKLIHRYFKRHAGYVTPLCSGYYSAQPRPIYSLNLNRGGGRGGIEMEHSAKKG